MKLNKLNTFMEIQHDHVQEFQRIYHAFHNKELPYEKARTEVEHLSQLAELAIDDFLKKSRRQDGLS